MKQFRVVLLLGWVAAQLAQGRGQPVTPPPLSGTNISPTEQALRLYGALAHRTLLRPGPLPQLSDALPVQMMADTNAALALVEKELAAKHIEVVRDGECFVRFLPEGWQKSALAVQLVRIKSPPKREVTNKEAASASMPAGTIDFRNAGIDQVIAIYSNLRHRTVLRPRRLSAPGITLVSQTSLSREEAIYAMNVVLALNGVAVVDDGENFVQVVPIEEAELVKPRAPQPQATEPLIAPEQVPVFVSGWLPLRPSVRPRTGEVANPLTPPPAPPPQPGVDELVAYYAKLKGQKASASAFHQQLVSFKAESSLTKAELLYAIETTLALDGLKIERQDDGTLQAVGR
jgi:hypothetical protein